jgi:MoxR-like ATPase
MILDKCVVGWDTVEPVFTANVAIRRPIIMLGKHGTGKSTAAKLMSGLYGEGQFRFYDAPKTDLIALAGIPDPDGLKSGKYTFCKHDNTIWDAKVVLVDEMSRANKASQNMWLEILQEKKLLGKDLVYEVLLATMNPQSYSSVISLDAALADRFSAVVNIPDPGEDSDLHSQTLEVLNINLNPDKDVIEENTIKDLSKIITETGKVFDSYVRDTQLRTAVNEYVASLISIIYDKSGKDAERVYISRRKPVQLAEEVMGIGAYFEVLGAQRPLEKGAEEAIAHTIAAPLKVPLKMVTAAHDKLREHLSSATMSREEKLRLRLASLGTVEEKLGFLVKNSDDVSKWPISDLEKELRDIFTSITTSNPEKVYKFITTLRKVGVPTTVQSEAEGFAVLKLNDWITKNIIMQDRRNWDPPFVNASAKVRNSIVSGSDKRVLAKILLNKDVEVDSATGKLKG